MAPKRSPKPVVSKAAQEEIKSAAVEAVKNIRETLERMNAEMTEFYKRRLQVRERIESGARKTSGRIV